MKTGAIVFFVSLCAGAAPPPHKILATIPCQEKPPAEIQVARGKYADGYCKLELKMRRGGKFIAEAQAELSIPAGTHQNGPTGHWFAREGDPNGEKGKTNLTITKGKAGPGATGVLLALTAVGEGEGLPATAYEYYLCRNDKLVKAWWGNDDGSGALADVILRDTNQDGFDDFTVKGGSFFAGDQENGNLVQVGVAAKVFVWSPKAGRFELKK